MAPHRPPSSRRPLRPAAAVSLTGVCALTMSARGSSDEPDASAHAAHSTPISDENLKEIDGDWHSTGTPASHGADRSLVDEPAKKPAYQRLKAVRAGHATATDGTTWTSPGGAQAAVSVLDDIRKAMVK